MVTVSNEVTNNLVEVDYIEGEDYSKDKSGFAKRAAGGYNGGKAGKRGGAGSKSGQQSKSDLDGDHSHLSGSKNPNSLSTLKGINSGSNSGV